MSEAAPVAPPAPPPAADRPLGFFETLVGLYVDPAATFRALMARGPRFWPALVGMVALTSVFTFVWLRHVDPVELTRHQLEESPMFDRIPPEQQAARIEQQAAMFPVLAWLGPVLGPVAFMAMAGVFLFVYRFFYASETTFKQALTVVFWSFFAVGLITTPLTLVILFLKGDWNIPPQSVVQASLAALLDRATAPKPLFALFDSLDLFSFWTLYLFSAGFAAAARRTVSSAAWGVVVLWAAYVVVKVGLSFVF